MCPPTSKEDALSEKIPGDRETVFGRALNDWQHLFDGTVSHAKIKKENAMSYEKIFEYELDITGVTDYGADMEAMFTGRQSVPLQGAQFDVTLAGPVKGRVTGTLRGVDYLRVRPDCARCLNKNVTALGCCLI
jgi:hypothetical protein